VVRPWPSASDQDGTLAAFLKPALSPAERAVARVEGWILGWRNKMNSSELCQSSPAFPKFRNLSKKRNDNSCVAMSSVPNRYGAVCDLLTVPFRPRSRGVGRRLHTKCYANLHNIRAECFEVASENPTHLALMNARFNGNARDMPAALLHMPLEIGQKKLLCLTCQLHANLHNIENVFTSP